MRCSATFATTTLFTKTICRFCNVCIDNTVYIGCRLYDFCNDNTVFNMQILGLKKDERGDSSGSYEEEKW